AIFGEADQHAGVGGAGDGADHDVVEGKTELLFPRPHFFGKSDIAEPAIFVYGGAGGDRIGLAARGLHFGNRLLPALADADVKAVVDQPDVGAHDAAKQDVSDAVVDGVLMRYPAFLHQPALHADLGRDGRDHAGVVG